MVYDTQSSRWIAVFDGNLESRVLDYSWKIPRRFCKIFLEDS